MWLTSLIITINNIFHQILSVAIASATALPEPPRGRFTAPQAPSLRQQLPRDNYGPPPPSDSYGEWENKGHWNLLKPTIWLIFRFTRARIRSTTHSSIILRSTTRQTSDNNEECLRSSPTRGSGRESTAANSWTCATSKTLQVDLHQGSGTS